MRKFVIGVAVAGLMGGGGVALGNHAGTNPTDPEAIGNHPALYGLCMAWHANETGRQNGNAGTAPPFAALQQAAQAAGTSVSDFCDGVRPGNGHGNGAGSQAPNPNQHPSQGNGNGNNR